MWQNNKHVKAPINTHEKLKSEFYINLRKRVLNIVCLFSEIIESLLKVVFHLSIEAKRGRSAGRQSKEPALEESNKSEFFVFLKEAGVTLRSDGTSNEIG